MEKHSFIARRTARYVTLGQFNAETRRVWFVLHGYGQLAEYFIRRFDVLDDGHTFVVAPEALSRFYLDGVGNHSGKIGATWMTREDRLNEIDDYLYYLNTLYHTLISEADESRLQIGLLGFSQGTATVCRWIAGGKFSVDKLILWAGLFPPDLQEFPNWERLKTIESILVYGDQDPYVKGEEVANYVAQLKQTGLSPRIVRFEGKHEVVREVIRQVTAF